MISAERETDPVAEGGSSSALVEKRNNPRWGLIRKRMSGGGGLHCQRRKVSPWRPTVHQWCRGVCGLFLGVMNLSWVKV